MIAAAGAEKRRQWMRSKRHHREHGQEKSRKNDEEGREV